MKRARNSRQLRGILVMYAVFAIPMGAAGYVLTHGIHADPLPDNAVTLSTSNDTYKVGESIKFYLSNNTTSTVYVKNDCPDEPLSVYRYTDGAWRQLHARASATLENCEDEPRDYPIPANTAVPMNYDEWPSLFSTPGRYELRWQVEGSSTVLRQDFEVTG